MKVANCRLNGYNMRVWVEDYAEIGDYVAVGGYCNRVKIVAFEESIEPDTELVNAEDLQVGDEIFFLKFETTLISI